MDYSVTVRKPEDVNGSIDTHNVQSSEESVEHFSVDNEAVQKVNFILFVLHKFHTFFFEGCCVDR